MGDDVVQFAGDAHAVEGHGLRRGELALCLKLVGAGLEFGPLARGGPCAIAERPRAGEVEDVGDDADEPDGDAGRDEADARVLGRERGIEGGPGDLPEQPAEHGDHDDDARHERVPA